MGDEGNLRTIALTMRRPVDAPSPAFRFLFSVLLADVA